jgi:hypothetical protein
MVIMIIMKRKIWVNQKNSPLLNFFDVIDYFKEKGFPIELAKKEPFEFYDTANWIDSKGNKVKNWKQKMLSVWLKPENKTQQNGQSKPSRQSATIRQDLQRQNTQVSHGLMTNPIINAQSFKKIREIPNPEEPIGKTILRICHMIGVVGELLPDTISGL